MATSRSTLPRSPSRAGYLSRLAIVAEVAARIWASRAARFYLALALAAYSGRVMAIVMPRGPETTNDALLLLVAGFAIGVLAAFVMRSRWAMLLAPVAHLAIFELARIGQTGPSVDAIHLDTAFGVIGLLVGRGVYLLVGLVPMAVGGAYGAALARWLTRRRDHAPAGRRGIGFHARRAIGGLSTAGVVALAAWIAVPASVPAVTGPNGQPAPNGIAELTAVELGGHRQWIEINGASVDNPVILYLNGGPGQSDLALSRTLLAPLHQDFTVVGWDQRGAGKSYASLDAGTLTLESVVSDTIELTNYLRDRFDEEKIYLLTESWGSVPGVLAVQRHPELYHAYIGSGQMVDLRATDRIIYEDLLAWAEEHGDEGMIDTLRGFGPPPYADIWAYAWVMQHYDKIEGDYDPPQAYSDRAEKSGVGFWGVMGSEYTFIDKANVFRGLLDMAAVMYPQVQDVDFREQVPRLEVPVYIFEGEHELRGRSELAHQWFDLLDAPAKRMVTYPDAGHAPAFEHADDLRRILLDEIVPAAHPDR